MIDLFLLKIKLKCMLIDIKHKIRRKLYCSNGYHKLTEHWLYYSSDTEKNNIRYHTCTICNSSFFENYEDIAIWIKLNPGWVQRLVIVESTIIK